jgi:hypothetical protein
MDHDIAVAISMATWFASVIYGHLSRSVLLYHAEQILGAVMNNSEAS